MEELYRMADGICANVWRRYRSTRYELADLQQEAYLALILAERAYRPELSVPFAAYAAAQINHALSAFIIAETSELSASITTTRSAIKMKKKAEEIMQKKGRMISDDELADELHVRPSTIRSYRSIMEKATSMNASAGDSDDAGAEIGDFYGTYDEDPIMSQELGDFYKKALDIIKGRLTKSQMYIFTHLSGINCRKEGVKDVAEALGLSVNRVSEYMHPSSGGGFSGSIIDTILALFEDKGITYAEFERMLGSVD